MPPSKVAPITDEEIIAVFTGERAQPLSSNEVATAIWTTRGYDTTEVASRHTKPVLDRMVTEGVLHRAEGRHAAQLVGRRAAARENVTYYHLAETANAILAEIEKNKHRFARMQVLAKAFAEHHPNLFASGFVMNGEVCLRLTAEQAEKLWDQLAPVLQPQPDQPSA